MVTKKRKKLTHKQKIIKLQNNIVKNCNTLWYPPNTIRKKQIQTNSWFDIKVSKSFSGCNIPTNNQINIPVKKLEKPIQCSTIKLKLTDKQKKVINSWMDAHTFVYNKTIAYINKKYKKDHKYSCSFYTLRNEMSAIIHKSMNKSKEIADTIGKIYNPVGKIPNYSVRKHMLDQSVKIALSNYKTCKTNLKKGHIKFFFLRKLKYNRKNKIMRIESSFFSKNGMCEKILGQMKGFYMNDKMKKKMFNFGDIKKDCILKYDSKINEYSLFVPEKPKNIVVKNINRKQLIAIDPGFRSFITGITENNTVEIGTNMIETIKRHLKKIENLKKIITNNKKRKQKIVKEKIKMKNVIDDFHWKTIKYLTDNHKYIMIGNLSTKGVIKKNGDVKSGSYKKAITSSRLYQFRQRLEYKCIINGLGYKKIDEYYTSKMCSRCSKINDPGSLKTYKCDNCNLIIDRDINGARNIYFKRNFSYYD